MDALKREEEVRVGRIVLFAVLSFAMILEGCVGRPAPIRNAVMGGTEVQGESKQLRPQVSAPARIYVQDFGLDAQAQEAGSASERPRLLRLPQESHDPAQQARRIVDLTAEAIVEDLNRSGLPASRLVPGAPLPADGWLVCGVFTEAGEGNTLLRAVIGFGSGSPKMNVQVGVSDLADQPGAPFVIFGTITDPERLPGGLVSRNPYVIAAKFVLEEGAPERDVKATAQTIADKIVALRAQVRAREGTPSR